MHAVALHATIAPAPRRPHCASCARLGIARAYAYALALIAGMIALGAVFGPH